MEHIGSVNWIGLAGLLVLTFIFLNGAITGHIFLGVGLQFSKNKNPFGYWICMSSILLFIALLFLRMKY